MLADPDSGDGRFGISISFVIIEDRVAISVIVETDLNAMDLGAKVMSKTKNQLRVGACLGKLQFNGAGFAVTVLQVAASMIECAGSAQ